MNWTFQPEKTKLMKIDLTNLEDRKDMYVSEYGFVALNGVNVNKNEDGLIVVDAGSSNVGFFDFDLQLQQVVDVGVPFF